MNKKGFTLIEVLISIVLLGIAISALLSSNTCFTNINGESLKLSNSAFLTEQIRQMTALLAVNDPETGAAIFGVEESQLENYDDLDDFDNKTFCPPINLMRSELNDFSDYSQKITVQNVSEANLEQVVSDNSSNMFRVTVDVSLRSEPLTSFSWLRARY